MDNPDSSSQKTDGGATTVESATPELDAFMKSGRARMKLYARKDPSKARSVIERCIQRSKEAGDNYHLSQADRTGEPRIDAFLALGFAELMVLLEDDPPTGRRKRDQLQEYLQIIYDEDLAAAQNVPPAGASHSTLRLQDFLPPTQASVGVLSEFEERKKWRKSGLVECVVLWKTGGERAGASIDLLEEELIRCRFQDKSQRGALVARLHRMRGAGLLSWKGRNDSRYMKITKEGWSHALTLRDHLIKTDDKELLRRQAPWIFKAVADSGSPQSGAAEPADAQASAD